MSGVQCVGMKHQDGENTCFTYCVAFLFGLDPKKVPFFIGNKNWVRSVKTYFKKKGYIIEPVPFKKSLITSDTALYLVQGLSKRSKIKGNAPRKKRVLGIQHAVIMRGKNRLYDPNLGGGWIKGQPTYLWKITPEIDWG